MPDFPYLHDLLGGYFHQRSYDDRCSTTDIIADFKAHSHAYQQLGVHADVQRLLHEHASNLLETIEQQFAPDILIGTSDTEAREWLIALDSALSEDSSSSTPLL
ncbi:MAG: hypothetical protein JWN04_2635 [Myxococcaceae bacterium]|nr:hypothetical protein [Myxococcaceae bacterium]